MIAPDVNVLVYAVREDLPQHGEYKTWLAEARDTSEPLALFEPVLVSALRILTNPRIFTVPTPQPLALEFVERLIATPNAVCLRAGQRHWEIFVGLCRSANCRGDLVPDAYFAALAIEHNCGWRSADRGFARFKGLHWRHPLEA